MRPFLLLALAAAAFASPASAQFGFALRASTLGIGGDVSYPVSPKFNVRLGGSYIGYSQSKVIDQDDISVQYNADGHAASGQLMADFFPMGNMLRLTGGLVLNLTEANAKVFSVKPYTINAGQPDEKTFSAERMGTLSAKVGYKNPVAPYLGFGFGNPTRGGFGFELEVGAMYAGQPKIEMSGTGLIGPTAAQAPELEKGLESFRIYPMLSLGLSFGNHK